MKKFLISFCFTLVATGVLFGIAKKRDLVFPQEQLDSFHKATPSKLVVVPKKTRKLLVYSRTNGYRHIAGIPAANEVLKYMGEKLGAWETVITDNPADITPENLKKYDALVLNSPTGACFGPWNHEYKKMSPEEQKKAIDVSKKHCDYVIEYVKNGGGLFGIHAAPDAYNYEHMLHLDYTKMIGGNFVSHPWYYKGPKYMLAVEDPKSPIVKGIWKYNAFMLQDEMYMVGDSFDRSKCRVLVRLVPELSYIPSEKARIEPPKVRDDGDFALVWIKSYGKGRVAYSGFGHADNNYSNPQLQELCMRLIQFVCGDLDADTTSIPMRKGEFKAPMCDAPTIEQIQLLRNTPYGKDNKLINELLFGVASNNFDKQYCAEVEAFIMAELKANAGTPFYKSVLAELLRIVQISSKKNCKEFEQIATVASDAHGVKMRLADAIDRFYNPQVVYTMEHMCGCCKSKTLPTNWLEQARMMKLLADNPKVAIPSYLKYENLDANGKARLIYTIGARGGDLSDALKLAPTNEALTVAIAYAVSKCGTQNDISKVLKGAKHLSTAGIKNIASYLISIKSKDLVKEFLKLIKTADKPQEALILVCLERLDFELYAKDLFDGYSSKTPEERALVLKLATAAANADSFYAVAKILPIETDKALKASALKAYVVSAQYGWKDNMFAQVNALYKQSDKRVKRLLVRLAPLASTKEAVEMCKDAYYLGFQADAIKALAEFKNANSLETLKQLSNETKNKKQLEVIKKAIADLSAKYAKRRR
ncbi:MAG: ThuA domain-containing protein [Verrucomicrobiaceae bacterium]|nr:ThuA domain-containing protein [Verrucomicrobiaceae bacterium]